ncbi:MAG: hypothetical protein GXO32_01495, partial [Crenarchaeota archaeon]|nr:hypothetical protein [Thermoproteota archaeon]
MNIWILISAGVAAFLAWNNGSNNAANMVGAAIGAGAISPRRALTIAAVFTLVGGVMLGRYVADTVMRKIVFVSSLHSFLATCLVMVSVLLSASLWTLVSSFLRVPMSVHACIIGSLIGVGLAMGTRFVNWLLLVKILVFWIFVPFIAAGLSAAMYKGVERALGSGAGLKALVLVSSFVSVFVPLLLSLVKTSIASYVAISIAALAGLASMIAAFLYLKRVCERPGVDAVEEAMKVLLVEAIISMSFSFGACSAANAGGPLAAIVLSGGVAKSVESAIQLSVVLAAVFLAVGIVSWGSCVVETVGRGITLLCPSSAFVS